MRLTWLHPLTESTGPFATVVIDASRDDPAGAQEVELRWRELAEDLTRQGAPHAVVDAIGAVVTEPTRQAGRLGRLLVATSDGVLLDEVLPEPPVRPHAGWSVVPQLMPVVRGFARRGSYVLALVDSAGADVTTVGWRVHDVDERHVDGSHDVLHDPGTGGWSQRRIQSRVQDSVRGNAGEAAGALATAVRQHAPDVVLVAGEEHPVSELLRQTPSAVSEQAVRLASGSRADGASNEGLKAQVGEAVRGRLADDRAVVLDRFSSALARQQGGVQGLASVVTSLQRAQVDHLLLHDDPTSDLTLWATGRPEQLAQSKEELAALGADVAQAAQQVPAMAAITWALVGTGAQVTLLEDGDTDLTDGIGALLRWADESTPGETPPSMPGHGEAPGSPST